MTMLHPATIAAIHATANRYEKQAADSRAVLDTLEGGKPQERENIQAEWAADADKFHTIAEELRTVATQKQHERSYGTARWLTNAGLGVTYTEASIIVAAVAANPAALEYRSNDSAGHAYHIRLVAYYCPILKEDRWAVEYTVDESAPGVSDNKVREDAAYRYWEIAKSMGQVQA